MSGKAVGWVLDHADAKGSELLLLVCIADQAKHDGTGAWPSTGTLAKRMRMSERAVRYIIGRLEAKGELAVQRRAGPHGCNLYSLPGMEPEDRQSLQGSRPAKSAISQAKSAVRQAIQGAGEPLVEPSIEPSALPEEKQTLLEHRSGLHDAPRLRCPACKEAS